MNDSTALLVPVDDLDALTEACRRLAADSVLSTRLGAAGRERAVTVFGQGDAIASYIRVYDEATANLARTLLART